jgi:hypothetical protein
MYHRDCPKGSPYGGNHTQSPRNTPQQKSSLETIPPMLESLHNKYQHYLFSFISSPVSLTSCSLAMADRSNWAAGLGWSNGLVIQQLDCAGRRGGGEDLLELLPMGRSGREWWESERRQEAGGDGTGSP